MYNWKFISFIFSFILFSIIAGYQAEKRENRAREASLSVYKACLGNNAEKDYKLYRDCLQRSGRIYKGSIAAEKSDADIWLNSLKYLSLAWICILVPLGIFKLVKKWFDS